MDFVHLARMRSFTPTAHLWGCTGALAAAATVVRMTADANAGVEVGQRGSCVISITDAAALPGFESLAENKKSNAGDAALQYPEDADPMASNPLRIGRNTPSAQHLKCPDSTRRTALDTAVHGRPS